MILAPQYGPYISKVPFSAVSVFSPDNSNLPKHATNGVYILMIKFWRTIAFELANCNEWSKRICHIHLQHLAQPLAIFGVPGTQKIFRKFPYPLATFGVPGTCNFFRNFDCHLQQTEFQGLVKIFKIRTATCNERSSGDL